MSEQVNVPDEWARIYEAMGDLILGDGELSVSEALHEGLKAIERIAALEAENARLSAPVTDAVMEELAAMEHERWSSQAIAALTDMTDARRERWTRQARLLYAGLTESEKDQDRQQVRKTLNILAARKGAA